MITSDYKWVKKNKSHIKTKQKLRVKDNIFVCTALKEVLQDVLNEADSLGVRIDQIVLKVNKKKQIKLIYNINRVIDPQVNSGTLEWFSVWKVCL